MTWIHKQRGRDPGAGAARLRTRLEAGTLTIGIEGRLDTWNTGRLWREIPGALQARGGERVIVDASGVDYCDLSGIALLLRLCGPLSGAPERPCEIRGLRPQYRRLVDLFGTAPLRPDGRGKGRHVGFVEDLGAAAFRFRDQVHALISFLGETTLALARAFLHPQSVRWRDTLVVAESAGVNALPLIALISFLIGLIMAFQSAIPMRQFGAEIYVANLIGLSMVRELGPLMTGIVLAGRSASAFAAELGTMRVNEEIDALTTMGLDPVRYLVVPRMVAAVAMTPFLTVFADLIGVAGGSIVLLSLGYPLVTYLDQVQSAVDYVDLLGGLFKALVFGLTISGIGCMRGLQTGTGASAVGESTTLAVVSGIVLIVVLDGIFSVLFYYLGI